MTEAGRQALVDLSGIDPASLRSPAGSVLDHALARALREQREGGCGYGSFTDEGVFPGFTEEGAFTDPPERDEDA
ncbi:hypothetical protein [Actinomadura opuntiae]|uniref:hypothetical protein n=1 Tax=Actinomadura sp. OS1-43 TaxID=604315 RepID=UPI00255B0FD1|nr:hypothetical protein [Actinomadura sp. OS1-43]MDL4813643.1 hypothetical protein [Actinomadura sp. OS1-43]